jgi:hypothetical protein
VVAVDAITVVMCVDPVPSLFKPSRSMSMLLPSLARIRSLCAFALPVTAASAQPDPGDMMKMSVSMKVQMPGAGTCLRIHLQGPRHARYVAATAGLHRQRLPAGRRCRQLSPGLRWQSAEDDWRARFELLLDGDIEGSVHANSSMGGRSVIMDMTYAGEHTGSCDYTASRQKR